MKPEMPLNPFDYATSNPTLESINRFEKFMRAKRWPRKLKKKLLFRKIKKTSQYGKAMEGL